MKLGNLTFMPIGLQATKFVCSLYQVMEVAQEGQVNIGVKRGITIGRNWELQLVLVHGAQLYDEMVAYAQFSNVMEIISRAPNTIEQVGGGACRGH